VRGDSYPGMISCRQAQAFGLLKPGNAVDTLSKHDLEGLLFTDIDDRVFRMIDEYEGPEFERKLVRTTVFDTVSQSCKHGHAWMYVTRPEFFYKLEPLAWNVLASAQRNTTVGA